MLLQKSLEKLYSLLLTFLNFKELVNQLNSLLSCQFELLESDDISEWTSINEKNILVALRTTTNLESVFDFWKKNRNELKICLVALESNEVLVEKRFSSRGLRISTPKYLLCKYTKKNNRTLLF